MIPLLAALLIGILFVMGGAQSAAQDAAEGEATGGYFFFGFIALSRGALDARLLRCGIDGAIASRAIYGACAYRWPSPSSL